MESYPEASVPVGGVLQADHLPLPILKAASFHGDSSGSGLTEVLLDQYTEVDVSSEWLSNFVEECLSSAGSCLIPAKDHQNETTTTTTTTTNPTPSKTPQFKPNKNKSPTHGKLAFPAKPRSQRKRKVVTTPKTHQNPLTKWSNQLKQRTHTLQSPFCDPPLLEQTYWLADSELLTMPRKEEDGERKWEEEIVVGMDEKMEEEVEKENSQGQQEQQQQPRRCTHCQAQKTPQWRAGPMGPKTLCNACGMRYFKSGRLLPEYRPAKSPTFVSYKHSNSHKVLQMRTSVLSSSTMQQ